MKPTLPLCYQIGQRRPLPPSNSMSEAEFRRALADGLAQALSLRVARHWVREHLRAARCKHPLGLAGWKERFEHDKPRRSITQDEFTQVLKDEGIALLGDDVYATEIHS